ncbi:MAG: preprotein translocase subunit YajC [Bacteroidota bacterium]
MIQFLLMAPAAGGAQSSGSGWFNMVFLVGIFAVMYFFMIRPQTKKAKDQKNFIDSIDKGTKIVTVSGVHGRITKVNENGTLEVEIDTNTKIVMERSGISMEMTKARLENKPV